MDNKGFKSLYSVWDEAIHERFAESYNFEEARTKALSRCESTGARIRILEQKRNNNDIDVGDAVEILVFQKDGEGNVIELE